MISAHGDNYYGHYAGVVVDNKDPKGIGRLRIQVPGVCEPSTGWALPFGIQGGGDTGVGSFDIPKQGAEVVVMFLQGDPDHPRWTYGHWGMPNGEADTPEPAKSAIAEDGPGAASQVKAYENDQMQMFTDLREDKARFVIRSKLGDAEDLSGPALMLEFDNKAGTLALSAPAGISLKSTGIIDIQGLVITLNGRPVLPTGNGI